MEITQEYAESNPSEKYLTKLCKRTFLNMWSRPHVYRKQKWNGGEGKELCDLLVLFENNIIIFSDKYCEFPNTGDLKLDWSRWFKRAIFKSAQQVWGAEKWLRKYPDRLFIDKNCSLQFPIPFPKPDKIKIHRIVVAHGCSKRCKQELGGSGSLVINTGIVGNEHYNSKSDIATPFTIGRLSEDKGFVHVLDDFTLDIVLETVDTITDFVNYLNKKQSLFESNKIIMVAGEENLLAHYLQNKHDFIFSNDSDVALLDDGFWTNFQSHPDRLNQIEVNKVSYAWDKLIDEFSKHILGGTLYHGSNDKVSDHEIGLRFLAREPRTRRRTLARDLFTVMERADKEIRAVRVISALLGHEPYYVFLSLDRKDNISLEDYRIIRKNLLQNYCMVTKLEFPEAKDIVGIGTEPMKYEENRSEDLAYLNARYWTKENQEEAKEIQNKYNCLVNVKPHKFTEYEYPRKHIAKYHKGSHRNKPCYCGSGKKYKKCCGKHQ